MLEIIIFQVTQLFLTSYKNVLLQKEYFPFFTCFVLLSEGEKDLGDF